MTTQTFDLYPNTGIALASDADNQYHSMAFDLNGGYSAAKVNKADIPKGYDIIQFGNFYHLDALHQNWKTR